MNSLEKDQQGLFNLVIYIILSICKIEKKEENNNLNFPKTILKSPTRSDVQ